MKVAQKFQLALIPIKNETTISSGSSSSSSETKIYTNKNVFVLKSNNQIKELHTVLRDKYIQLIIFLNYFF